MPVSFTKKISPDNRTSGLLIRRRCLKLQTVLSLPFLSYCVDFTYHPEANIPLSPPVPFPTWGAFWIKTSFPCFRIFNERESLLRIFYNPIKFRQNEELHPAKKGKRRLKNRHLLLHTVSYFNLKNQFTVFLERPSRENRDISPESA